MAVVKGAYAKNEEIIFNYLVSKMGFNTAAACGILVNFFHESGFNPKNLQDSYQSSLGYTDKTYTSAVDSGKYRNFSRDSAGYGLAQWTFSSRKKKLLDFAKKKGKSIGDLLMQLDYFSIEITEGYYASMTRDLKNVSNTSTGAADAAEKFCRVFEAPANIEARVAERRKQAQEDYWPEYSGSSPSPSPGHTTSTTRPVLNKGQEIVDAAMDQVGDVYKVGGYSPGGFDSAGLVYYSYNEAGEAVALQSAKSYYNTYKSRAKSVKLDEVSAGDLLFYTDASGNITNMAIADGAGGRIHSAPYYGVVHMENVGNPTYILRILADTETSQGDIPITADIDPETGEPAAVSVVDDYSLNIMTNMIRMESEGFDYGYLIDMTHGGEFRFYIPEFSESAGANWADVGIMGRSVSVQAYENTSSRSVTVSLDLYAGAGLYEGEEGRGSEMVDKLHQDLNFLRSLEYPDYSNAIARPPSVVHLILGPTVDFEGIVSEVHIEHLKPVDSQNRSLYVKVSFKVTQISTNPPDWSDIRSGTFSLTGSTHITTMETPTLQNVRSIVKNNVKIEVN